MIHTLNPDSAAYLSFNYGNIGHPLPQIIGVIFNQTAGLNALAVAQIAAIVASAHQFNKRLGFSNHLFKWASFAVLAAPAAYWGRQIGSDALGYAAMLCALSQFRGNKPLFSVWAAVTTLCRMQYAFLFVGLLWDRKTLLWGLGLILGALWAFPVAEGRLNLTARYLKCAYDTKPSHLTHDRWFDMSMGGDRDIVAPAGCYAKTSSLFSEPRKLALLIGSKVKNGFRFHSLALLALMCLLPFSGIMRDVARLNAVHYALVILTSSLFYTRYTFMSETTMIAVAIRFYETLRYADWRRAS